MKHRYSIRNNTHFAEFPFTPQGREEAKAFRASRPEFKGRHIRDLIQACPSQIATGHVHAFS